MILVYTCAKQRMIVEVFHGLSFHVFVFLYYTLHTHLSGFRLFSGSFFLLRLNFYVCFYQLLLHNQCNIERHVLSRDA